ncbi:unnamed protein product [Polarella glacialis]|uniref:Uncharacterized protein n=1 Tax=Polarella glacialis TaxID=89957 RepID=A0A813DS34_POLGL|nr:unnamed protein product [Polarella glacialis]
MKFEKCTERDEWEQQRLCNIGEDQYSCETVMQRTKNARCETLGDNWKPLQAGDYHLETCYCQLDVVISTPELRFNAHSAAEICKKPSHGTANDVLQRYIAEQPLYLLAGHFPRSGKSPPEQPSSG